MSLVRREFLALYAAGVAGVILVLPYSLALSPLPKDLSLPIVFVAVLAQNAVVVGIAVAAGLWFAGRVGLGAPHLESAIRGEPIGERLRAMLPPAIALGLAVSVVVLFVEALVFLPQLPPALRGAGALPPLWSGFLASFYGGITEELLTRLFLVSLFAWLCSRVASGAGVYWAAIVTSAILFGLGRLPTTARLVPLTPLVVARAVVLNGIPGLVFGWLFWRRGLEAAMVAHFSADLVVHVMEPAALS